LTAKPREFTVRQRFAMAVPGFPLALLPAGVSMRGDVAQLKKTVSKLTTND